MILFRPRQETKEQTSWKRRNAKIVEKVPEEMEIPEKSKAKEEMQREGKETWHQTKTKNRRRKRRGELNSRGWQSSCLSRKLHKLQRDFNQHPFEVLLFWLNSTKVQIGLFRETPLVLFHRIGSVKMALIAILLLIYHKQDHQ